MHGSSSDSSSGEETAQQEALQDDSTSAKRSYECTFCRRGFTNAQALGGHMNIHRKDRTKAKQGTTNSSESMTLPFIIPEIPSQTSTYYSIFESQRNYNHDIHFNHQPISSNYYYNPRNYQPPPPPPPSYAPQYEFLNSPMVSHSQSLNMNQEVVGPNLSLQIGPSHHHVDHNSNQIRRGIQNKDGELVDLELRLGHDPYSNYQGSPF